MNRKIGKNTAYNDPKTGQFVIGNPGKPLGTKHLSTQLNEMLFEKVKNGETQGTLLNKQVLKKSIVDGDMRAIELVYDRVEGKPIETSQNINVNVSVLDDNAIDEIAKRLNNEMTNEVHKGNGISSDGEISGAMAEEVRDENGEGITT